MPADLTFTVTLSPALQRGLSDLGTLAGGPLRRYFARVGERVVAQYVAEAPEDEGELKRAYAARVDPAVVPSSVEITNTSPHAPFVHGGEDTDYEWGRRPGLPPPPPDALTGWAARHGFSIEPGALFVLARKIGETGIKAHPSWPVPFQHALPDVEGGLLRQLALDVEAAWQGRTVA